MHRTHTCGELTSKHIGTQVTLAGRVNKHRDLGGMTFVDLRDRYGITQITIDPKKVGEEVAKQIEQLKSERCIKVTGEIVARPDNMINKDMPTGKIELIASNVEVLSQSEVLPFPVSAEPNTSEENRMKYRYLDLRRRDVLKNIEFRAKMNNFTRNWFTDQQFLEVQTPICTVSSPEGARDFLVPSRVNPGQFYALPQAPQQYKQLLMIGGIDKYFQIAPCFRDEDPRADRAMCEFYQVDLEMSFVEQADVLKVLEQYSKDTAQAMVPHKTIVTDFPHISYHDAMDQYGTDRPDMRFDMKLIDVSEIVRESEFGIFSKTITSGGVVKAIKLDQQELSRKDIDEITEVAKHAGAGGLAYIKFTAEGPQSPIVKFLNQEELTGIQEITQAKAGDIVFFGADRYSKVCKVLDKVRLHCRDKYNLVDDNDLAFCIVVDFPFYEYDEDKDTRDFGHNPFSMIVGGLEGLETDDFSQVMTQQYDVVLNGYELGSGSIRNHNPEIMVKAFEKIGKDTAEIKEKFGAMYNAFKYGPPPHGGFAFGFDRFMMVLLDEPNIRECYAFPKSGRAQDVMMGAPGEVDDKQLEELSIKIKIK